MLARIASSIVLSSCLAGGVFAQPASYGFFGAGCPNPVVPLTVVGVPSLGGTFTVQTDGSVFGQISVRRVMLVTGISNTQAGTVPLPFDMSALTSPSFRFCGPLLTSTEIIQFVPPSGELSFTVPNIPALLGGVLFQQVLQTDLARMTGVTFISSSRGGRAVIGT